MPLLLTGFATGLSLIVAIGAQNAFVLRQGLRREHVLPVAALCATADALLVTAGVAGVGTLVESAPLVVDVLRWGGVAFLLAYAALALRRALRPGALVVEDRAPSRLLPVLGTAAALTFLNPHVYLDTVLLLGSIAAQHGPDGRWVFAAGAVIASVVWFFGFGLGARRLAPLFTRPAAWRVVDLLVAAVMVAVAVGLVTSAP